MSTLFDSIIDPLSLPSPTRLDADVVIIGSGGGGAPAAWVLAGAGLDVIVIEAGKHVRPEEFTQRELDMIRTHYVDRGGQVSASGAVNVLQGSLVGGSTVMNGEVCFRTPDFVLQEWAQRFGVRGMSVAEMAPVFDEVEAMIHVTENADVAWATAIAPARGMTALGIEPKRLKRNVKGCHGCNYCFWGCAYGCKQSMDQSYLPAAAERGIRLVPGVRVDQLLRSGSGAAVGVSGEIVAEGSHARQRLNVRAKTVIVACGAISTPLLLADNGLGGREVGHHLALHPLFFGSGLFTEVKPERPGSLLAGYTDHFLQSEGHLIEVGGAPPPFSAVGLPGHGRAHKERTRDWLHRTWGGGVLMRDATSPGRVRRSKRGRKVIDYDLDSATQTICRSAMKRFGEIMLAAGAELTWFSTTAPHLYGDVSALRAGVDRLRLGPPDLAMVSYHPQGTARLGVVTDHDGQVRGTSGVYVMDTSLFPTPVGVNPQVSVMAVSTVLARRLAATLGT